MIKKVYGIGIILLILASVFVFAEPQMEDPAMKGKTVITYTRWAGTQEAVDFQKLVDRSSSIFYSFF